MIPVTKELAMIGWTHNIEEATLSNTNFRTVLFTTPHSQIVVMSLKPGEEIGNEIHPANDQFIRFEAGHAKIQLSLRPGAVDEEHEATADFAVVVPAGTWHNIINDSDEDLKLYTVYSPADHPDGLVQKTKAEADRAEEAEKSA